MDVAYKITSHQRYPGLFLSSNMCAVVVADMEPDEVQEQILRQLQQMNQRFEALREDVETLKGEMQSSGMELPPEAPLVQSETSSSEYESSSSSESEEEKRRESRSRANLKKAATAPRGEAPQQGA